MKFLHIVFAVVLGAGLTEGFFHAVAWMANVPHQTCVTEVYRQSRTALLHERTCIWTVGK